MSTNFLYAQSPNRTGNMSKHTPSKTGGATNVTAAKHGMAGPKGQQGAPKAGGNAFPVGNKVSVSYPKDCYDCSNTGYLKNSSYTK
jgi:hypothetical protein